MPESGGTQKEDVGKKNRNTLCVSLSFYQPQKLKVSNIITTCLTNDLPCESQF